MLSMSSSPSSNTSDATVGGILPHITINVGDVEYPTATIKISAAQKRHLKQKTLAYINANENIGQTFSTGNFYLYEDAESGQNSVANVAIHCIRKEKIVCMPGRVFRCQDHPFKPGQPVWSVLFFDHSVLHFYPSSIPGK